MLDVTKTVAQKEQWGAMVVLSATLMVDLQSSEVVTQKRPLSRNIKPTPNVQMSRRLKLWQRRLEIEGEINKEHVVRKIAALPYPELLELLAFCTSSFLGSIFGRPENQIKHTDCLCQMIQHGWKPVAADFLFFLSLGAIAKVVNSTSTPLPDFDCAGMDKKQLIQIAGHKLTEESRKFSLV